MTEQTDAAEVLAEAICPCAGDGDGQHIPELDQECAWSLSLARAILASDWLAAREAAAEARGAQAVLAAVEALLDEAEIGWTLPRDVTYSLRQVARRAAQVAPSRVPGEGS